VSFNMYFFSFLFVFSIFLSVLFFLCNIPSKDPKELTSFSFPFPFSTWWFVYHTGVGNSTGTDASGYTREVNNDSTKRTKYLLILLRYDNICTKNLEKFVKMHEKKCQLDFRNFFILLFSNSYCMSYEDSTIKWISILFISKISFWQISFYIKLTSVYLGLNNMNTSKTFLEKVWQCSGCAMQFSAEIRRQ
jgi:hypothetical protein